MTEPVTSNFIDKLETFKLRNTCAHCNCLDGYSIQRNGQEVVYCASCDKYAYNRPRSESGRPVKSTRSRPNIKPSLRMRVLAAHDHRCVYCGRSPATDDIVLDIDHLVPVALAKKYDLYDEVIESEHNLVPACAQCNRGKQDDLNRTSITLMYRVLLMKATKHD